MESLIAELESAAEGSRELDAKIWEQLGLVDEKHCQTWCNMDGRTDLTREMFIDAWAPSYSRSLDSALTLVPEGMLWRIGTAEAEAEVIWESAPSYYTKHAIGESWTADGDTFNAALALCIASLRARQATEPS